MSTLITGANGFLGENIIKELIERKEEVIALVRSKSKINKNLSHPYVKWVEGDILDKKSLNYAFELKPKYVIHCAGVIGYKPSMRPLMDQVNVLGTQNMLDVSSHFSIERFVHLSSVVTIGASFKKGEIRNESSPYNLKKYNLGYFETKRKAEICVLEKYKETGLPTICVNPSTIYGPGDGKKGSRGIQRKVAKGTFPFYTNGGVSIIDSADCVSAILNARNRGKLGERYILSGDNITIKTLFTYIANSAGVQPPQYLLPNFIVTTIGHFGDLLNSIGYNSSIASENSFISKLFHWFSNEKAKAELGLQVRPAEESIDRSIHSMKEDGIL